MDSLRQIRVPLALPLLAVLAGIVGASRLPTEPLWLLAAALPTAGVALFLAVTCRAPRLWALLFCGAATLAFWTYGQLRLPYQPPPQVLELPQREACVAFEIERLFGGGSPYGTRAGVARVVSAGDSSKLRPDMLLYVQLRSDSPDPTMHLRGATIRATGILEPIPGPPDELDAFNSFLKDSGIHYRFGRLHEVFVLEPPGPLDRFYQSLNLRFQELLRLGDAHAAPLSDIYVAMLLGRKSALSTEQSDRFRMSGTMHFFAISGLHIGVIATVLAQALLLLRVPSRVSPFIGLPLLWIYVETTGAAPSAVRAFLMVLFFWLSFAFRRQRSPLAALVASALFVLCLDPGQLWNIGFQLSYSVVLSILLLGLPLYAALKNRIPRFSWLPPEDRNRAHRRYQASIDKLALLFAISFAAWLASTPLSAGIFGFIAPGAIVLNMLLVNLAALAIISGMLALASGLLGLGPLAAYINHAAWVLLASMDGIIDSALKVPGMVLTTPAFPKGFAYGILVVFLLLLFAVQALSTARSTRLWLAPCWIVATMTAVLLIAPS